MNLEEQIEKLAQQTKTTKENIRRDFEKIKEKIMKD